jgi:PAT family beta-lactamase induction signal transducer AmpG
MIVSGGLALIWTDAAKGGGWTWPDVYRLMAGLMVAAAVVSALLLPRLPEPWTAPRRANARHASCWALAPCWLAVPVGVLLTDRFGPAVARALLGGWLAGTTLPAALQGRWIDLAALLAGHGLHAAAGRLGGAAARFETLLAGLRDYFSQPGAAAILVLIVLYKLGDAFAGALLTPFLLKGVGYASAEVGVVNKVHRPVADDRRRAAGRRVMLRLGLWRALLLFGVLQMASNLGFWWLAQGGRGQLGAGAAAGLRLGLRQAGQATPVDGGLLVVVAIENLSGGMGTAAFLAFLMSLCSQRFTATQFALLSAFASVGRVWVGPLAGVLAETIGWPHVLHRQHRASRCRRW